MEPWGEYWKTKCRILCVKGVFGPCSLKLRQGFLQVSFWNKVPIFVISIDKLLSIKGNPVCDRYWGPPVQGRQDSLVGGCLWIQHVLSGQGCRHRTSGRCCRQEPSCYQRLSAKGIWLKKKYIYILQILTDK